MLYSFPVSILWWESPCDYASLSQPGPLCWATTLRTQRPNTLITHSQTLLNTYLSWPQIFVSHAQMKLSRMYTDKDDKDVLCASYCTHSCAICYFVLMLSNNTHTHRFRVGKFSLTLSVCFVFFVFIIFGLLQCSVDPHRICGFDKEGVVIQTFLHRTQIEQIR